MVSYFSDLSGMTNGFAESLTACIAAVVSAWTTWRLIQPTAALRLLDHPNERSLHKIPTPRTGGVAIITGLAAGVVSAAYFLDGVQSLWPIAVAATAVAGVSFLDDRWRLPVGLRLATHVGAAALVILAGFFPSGLAIPVSMGSPVEAAAFLLVVLFLVWVVNLYNFMDGMDGFAGGMAVIGFCAFAALGWLAGQPLFVTLNLVVVGAVGGFLIFNFPPARIFMGDTGSSTLGLIAGAFMFWASRDDIFPLWAGVLIFSPFVVDATATLVRRMLRRDNIWLAHKTHYYQRLVELGWGHKRTTLAEYGLMVLCALSAVLASRRSSTVQLAVISGWVVIYAGLMIWVDWWGRRVSRRA